MNFAPIVLFVYNRPWHTQQTVEALLKNAEAGDSDLIVFSDGAKDDVSRVQVDEVRQYLRTIKGFKSIRIVDQDKNRGLAQSIISGVTEVVNEFGCIIVLEDDMVTSPYFLKYMNDGLELYASEDKVISVHAYSFPIENLPETFFIKGASCWGWATWKRGWGLFEGNGSLLFDRLQEAGLMDRFNLCGAYPYETMLLDQIQGKNDSWAIRWYASALLKDKLSLHPGRSLLMNIGVDGSGTHCGSNNTFYSIISDTPVRVGGIEVDENKRAFNQWLDFFTSKVIASGRLRMFVRKVFGLFRKY